MARNARRMGEFSTNSESVFDIPIRPAGTFPLRGKVRSSQTRRPAFAGRRNERQLIHFGTGRFFSRRKAGLNSLLW